MSRRPPARRPDGGPATSPDVPDEHPATDVDLHALRENLALTPAERVAELVEMNRLHHDVQERSLTLEQRELLMRLEVEQARARLGHDDPLA